MGFGEYNNIGVSMQKGMERSIRQVMDCLFPNEVDCGTDYTILPDFRATDWSRKGGWIEPLELFHLMNTLFGPTYVYVERGQYNTVCDEHERDEEIYDPISMEKRSAGEWSSPGTWEGPCYYLNQDKLRERLKAENLYERLRDTMRSNPQPLSDDWDCTACEESDEYDCVECLGYQTIQEYELDEWYETTERILAGLGDVSKLLRDAMCEEVPDVPGDSYENTTPIEKGTVSQPTIDRLIQSATQKGHTELVALILEKTK